MPNHIKRTLYFIAGITFFIIGGIGLVLPLLPTTPFMIIAASCFAKSSPQIHQMLLNNALIGADLCQWEHNKTMQRATKKRATLVIIISFSLSIVFFLGQPIGQLLLTITAFLLLFFIWRLAES
jgi:uncharacterized membrane protein YbaN (DUF454 family)